MEKLTEFDQQNFGVRILLCAHPCVHQTEVLIRQGRKSRKHQHSNSRVDYFGATGEIEKESRTLELWIANDPRDYIPHANLDVTYPLIGQYEKAAAESQEALRLATDDVAEYANLGETYLNPST